MAVFRVEKTRDFTVMSNHHLRNKNLSLRAKGLLSVMLSLPEEWDYTLKGLAHISKEGVDAIRSAIKELEKFGYIERHRKRNKKYPLSLPSNRTACGQLQESNRLRRPAGHSGRAYCRASRKDRQYPPCCRRTSRGGNIAR